MHKDAFIKLVKESGIGHWMLTEACADVFEWEKWCQEIPYISFPAHWQVRIIPPYAATIVRFQVKHPKGYDISICLDCYSHLGYCEDRNRNPIPYWEVYTAANGDTARFAMNDTKGLIAEIELALISSSFLYTIDYTTHLWMVVLGER